VIRRYSPSDIELTLLRVFVTVGGSFFLSAAQSAFNNTVVRYLATNLPTVDPKIVLGTGATEIRNVFSATDLPIVLGGYMVGLKAVFAITIAASGVATFIGFFGSWKKLQAEEVQNAAGGAA
jgi:MFS transporter, DHA2 family, glioxin efflux transporter